MPHPLPSLALVVATGASLLLTPSAAQAAKGPSSPPPSTSLAAAAVATNTWTSSPPVGGVVASTAPQSFAVTVKTPTSVPVDQVHINLQDEGGNPLPLAVTRGVTLSSSGLLLTAEAVLPPGTYAYRTGYLAQGTWTNVGEVRTFTVAPSSLPAEASSLSLASTSASSTSFSFQSGKLPAGGRLEVTWSRGGRLQKASTTNLTWGSGKQAGWSNAQARIVSSSGAVLAATPLLNPGSPLGSSLLPLASSSPSTPPASGRWVNAYAVPYLPLTADQVSWGSLTHLTLAFLLPRADGSLGYMNDYQTREGFKGWMAPFVARGHQEGKKVLASVGGANQGGAFLQAASDPTTRGRLASNLVTYAHEVGLDGLDLDWEPLPSSSLPSLVALAEEIHRQDPSLLLTTAVGAVNNNLASSMGDYSAVAATFDQVNIMSYGMSGPWEGWSSAHSGGLYGATPTTPMSLATSVDAYRAHGVPSKKLGAGIGFFGNCYKGPTDPYQATTPAQYLGDDGPMSYKNILAQYASGGTLKWDATAKAPYLSSATPLGPLGCTFVSYENPRSIQEKATYVKDQGLGGAIVWTLNEGLVDPSTPLPPGEAKDLLSAVGTSFLP